jgi:peptidyl-tRNA hydrolase
MRIREDFRVAKNKKMTIEGLNALYTQPGMVQKLGHTGHAKATVKVSQSGQTVRFTIQKTMAKGQSEAVIQDLTTHRMKKNTIIRMTVRLMTVLAIVGLTGP